MAVGLFSPQSVRISADDTPLSLPRVAADSAHAARPLFLRLTEALVRVAELLGECRKMEARATRHDRRWGVPALFFSDPAAEREWRASQAPKPVFPQPYLGSLAQARPKLAAAWSRLPDLLDDALALLADSIDVRRMARAIPGLRDAARAVPQAAELAGVLAMPEEEVWLVIHPAARAGYRVTLDGVADIAQLHVLLADALTGDPGDGYLSGRRPGDVALDACRETGWTEGVEATARFQFYRPEALRADGRLPVGFAGSDHWYWGTEALGCVPQENSERILVLGEPVLPKVWEVNRRHSRIAARAEVLEVLPRAEVERWLQARCPEFVAETVCLARAG